MPAKIDFFRYSGSLPRTKDAANLSPGEARDCLSRGAVLVDLREPYETNFRVFDVEKLLYLPWTKFSACFEVLPRDEALILADAAGIYGREAIRILVDAGYSNLANLVGGMIDWDREGLPVKKDPSYELSGQCACRLKTRKGSNPLIGIGGCARRSTR
jgi:rhodanese-related sulfurtransferase